MARGNRFGRHWTGIGVDGDVDDSGDGQYAPCAAPLTFVVRAPVATILRGILLSGCVQFAGSAILLQLPVEPNPPLPREVFSRDAVSTI